MRRILAGVGIAVVVAPWTFGSVAGAQQVELRRVALIVNIALPSGLDPLLAPDGEPSKDAQHAVAIVRNQIEPLVGAALPPFALRISPVLCDELELLGTRSARHLLDDLRRIATKHPIILTPYADLRLGGVTGPELTAEIETARSALRTCTGRDPIDVLAASDLGVPDQGVVTALSDGPVGWVLSGYAFPRSAPGDEADALPRAVAAVIAMPLRTASSDADAFLDKRRGTDRLAVMYDASPTLVAIFTALADDARIAVGPLTELLAGEQSDDEGPLYEPRPLSDEYRRTLDEATAALDELDAITFESTTLFRILRTVLAEGRATADGTWAGGPRAVRWLEELRRTISRQLTLVSLTEGSVTFTSRRGSVPVTVSNRASYPVKVRVSLQSSKVSFPNGPTALRTIDPPGDTITFDAIARSSGTFPINAVLKSPNGKVDLDAAKLSVRSTAANLPVLILTIGGAIFLVVVYGSRIGRRRRDSK